MTGQHPPAVLDQSPTEEVDRNGTAGGARARTRRGSAGRLSLGAELIGSALIVMLPGLLTSAYHLRVLTDIATFALLAMGLNLIFGYTGRVSLGHAAFYAVGAYGSAILEVKAGLPIVVAWPLAVALAMAAAWIISFPILRLHGHYLALGTLAIGLITSTMIAQGAKDFTGGHDGIHVPAGEVLGPFLAVYFPYVVVGTAVLAYWALRNLTSRSIGRALRALRDDPDASASLGIPVVRYRVTAFVIAAGLAAVAGIFYTHISKVITPEVFSFDTSIQILVMVIIGGMGHRLGGPLGAAVVLLLPNLLLQWQGIQHLIYALLVLAVLLFLPNGLAGLPALVRDSIRKARRTRGKRGEGRAA